MNIRSTVVAVLGLLVLPLLTAGVADADSRVVVFGARDHAVSAAQAACDTHHQPVGPLEPAAEAYPLSLASGSVLHDDSLRVVGAADRVIGLAVDLASSADLATLRVSAYSTSAARVSLLTNEGWLPSIPFAVVGRHADDSWWFDLDASGAVPGDLGPVTAFVWFGFCGGYPDSVEVDGLAFGPAGDVTTYDFEGTDSVRLDMLGSSGAPGRARWALYCALSSQPDPTQGLEPVVGEPLVLESRPHGNGRFRVVGVARTSEYGQAIFHDRPRRLTDYRCRYDGDDGAVGKPYPALVSSVYAMKVPTHVTIRARRTDHGRRVVATGTADPRHPGTRVTLLVKGIPWDAESRVLARGRLSRRGTYELSARLGRGPWQVYVRVAKAPGNAVSTSTTRYVE